MVKNLPSENLKTAEEPKFGVKGCRLVYAKFADNDETETDLIRVEFLNGRVYHSKWTQNPETCRCYISSDEDEAPILEQEMEFLVVESLCHSFLGDHK